MGFSLARAFANVFAAKAGPEPRQPATDAFRTTRRNGGARTPRHDDPRRLPFVAPLITPGFSIARDATIFTTGSCFARNIEVYLDRIGFDVPMVKYRVPPEELYKEGLGTPSLFNKYTTPAMLQDIQLAFGALEPETALVPFQDGYFDTQLHTNKVVSLERGLERRREIATLVRDSVGAAQLVVVTLELTEAWHDNETGLTLNETPHINLVRAHPNRFSFKRPTARNVFDTTEALIQTLKTHGHPRQRVLLTVSPVPLGRTFTAEDAMVANCATKSVLRTAADIVVESHDHVEYFPFYESVTLSDRARVWADDGLHVLKGAIEFNTERMVEAYVEKAPDAAGAE